MYKADVMSRRHLFSFSCLLLHTLPKCCCNYVYSFPFPLWASGDHAFVTFFMINTTVTLKFSLRISNLIKPHYKSLNNSDFRRSYALYIFIGHAISFLSQDFLMKNNSLHVTCGWNPENCMQEMWRKWIYFNAIVKPATGRLSI